MPISEKIKLLLTRKEEWIIPGMILSVWSCSLLFPRLLDMPSWLEMTISGLAMGMLIFMLSAGLSLVFGMMDVLNFAHGTFFTFGGYAGWKLFDLFVSESMADFSSAMSILVVIGFIIFSGGLAGAAGWLMEKLIIRKFYHQHLNQILVTMGLLVVGEEVFRLAGLQENEYLSRPGWFQDSWFVGQWYISRFQVFVILTGTILFLGLYRGLKTTRLGMMIRAGIENPELLMSSGHNIHRIFSLVFLSGAALAGIGGVLWGFYNESVDASMGSNVQIFAFIVVIIGGLGSLGGSLLGSLIIGLSFSYIAYFLPEAALVSNFVIMIVVLMWRPEGLIPVRS